MRIVVNGATPSDVTYVITDGSWHDTQTGFRWASAATRIPVKKIVIKRTPSGRAALLVRLEISQYASPVSIVPPNPGTGGALVLITNLNTYCVTLGDAAGGRVGVNTAQVFQVTNATSQPGCPPPDPRCCRFPDAYVNGFCGMVPWPSLCTGTLAPSGYSCDSVTGTCVPGTPSPGVCYEGCGFGIFPVPAGCAAGPDGCFGTPIPNAVCTPTGCASPSGAFLASTDGF
jgi:hypothetical protein